MRMSPTSLVVVAALLRANRALADSGTIMDKPHPVFGVPMGVVLLVFVAIAALKQK